MSTIDDTILIPLLDIVTSKVKRIDIEKKKFK